MLNWSSSLFDQGRDCKEFTCHSVPATLILGQAERSEKAKCPARAILLLSSSSAKSSAYHRHTTSPLITASKYTCHCQGRSCRLASYPAASYCVSYIRRTAGGAGVQIRHRTTRRGRYSSTDTDAERSYADETVPAATQAPVYELRTMGVFLFWPLDNQVVLWRRLQDEILTWVWSSI